MAKYTITRCSDYTTETCDGDSGECCEPAAAWSVTNGNGYVCACAFHAADFVRDAVEDGSIVDAETLAPIHLTPDALVNVEGYQFRVVEVTSCSVLRDGRICFKFLGEATADERNANLPAGYRRGTYSWRCGEAVERPH